MLLLAVVLSPPVTILETVGAQGEAVPVMLLVVDESRAAQRIVTVHEELPVQAGALEFADR